MTLLIACLLLNQMHASPDAYVGAFILWIMHLMYNGSPSAQDIANKLKDLGK